MTMRSLPYGSPSERLLTAVWIACAVVAVLIACTGIAIAYVGPAMAQDATAAPSFWQGIVLQPFVIELFVTIFGPLLVAVILAVLTRLYALIGLQQGAENRAAVEQILRRAIGFARDLYASPKDGVIPDDVREAAIRQAAAYAYESGPATFGKLGVTGPGSERLEKMVRARLGEHVGFVEWSPETGTIAG